MDEKKRDKFQEEVINSENNQKKQYKTNEDKMEKEKYYVREIRADLEKAKDRTIHL